MSAQKRANLLLRSMKYSAWIVVGGATGFWVWPWLLPGELGFWIGNALIWLWLALLIMRQRRRRSSQAERQAHS
jgi:hypothetical protein